MASLLAVVSAVLWGAADFGGGLASRRLPALAVVGWSQGVALIGLLVAVAVVRPVASSSGWLGWGLLSGAAGAVGLVCFYRALAIGTMGVVSPIGALGGVVPVIAALLGGERPTTMQAWGIAMALVGVVAASGPELAGRASAASVALAALAGLMFGICLLTIARGAAAQPLLTTMSMRLASLVLFGGVALLGRTTGGVGRGDLRLLAGVGLGDAAANLGFGLASTLGMVSVVAVLGSLYPVVTVLLARWLLGERLRPVQSAGVALALAGTALLSLG